MPSSCLGDAHARPAYCKYLTCPRASTRLRARVPVRLRALVSIDV